MRCRHCENKVDAINNVQPTVVKKNKEKNNRKCARAKKRKSIKRLMRQMKRRQQRKAKVDEAVTNA